MDFEFNLREASLLIKGLPALPLNEPEFENGRRSGPEQRLGVSPNVLRKTLFAGKVPRHHIDAGSIWAEQPREPLVKRDVNTTNPRCKS